MDTPIHINRSHLLASCCASRPASCVDWAYRKDVLQKSYGNQNFLSCESGTMDNFEETRHRVTLQEGGGKQKPCGELGNSSSGFRGLWGAVPLATKIFFKSCSFQANLRVNPLFWARGSPSGQNCWPPLTKILYLRLNRVKKHQNFAWDVVQNNITCKIQLNFYCGKMYFVSAFALRQLIELYSVKRL